MSILDKLLEKKDVLTYIDYRTAYLKRTFNIYDYPEEMRELMKERHDAKVAELDVIKIVVNRGMLKKMSEIYYFQTERDKADDHTD